MSYLYLDKIELQFIFDAYKTLFSNQVFPDYESDPQIIIVNNFKDNSESNSFQAEIGIEIIDEGTYAESQIVVAADSITLTHTASALGRPVINGSGLGSTEIISLAPNGSTHRRSFTLNGIEVKGSGNSSQELFKHNNNFMKFKFNSLLGYIVKSCSLLYE